MAYVDSLRKLNDTNKFNAGIRQLRQPGVISAERLFVGKNKDGEVGLFLRDANGKPRLKVYISPQNQPVIEVLDNKGKVVASR